MKIAIAGKGGVGKTTLVAWLGDYLARLGQMVWMVDADTALSLGQASGLSFTELPEALIQRKELFEERICPNGGSMLNLTPQVSDLPEALFVSLPISGTPFQGMSAGEKRLLVMGGLYNAGHGCACNSNALLKALLAHLVLERKEWVLVDMEAGVEHLGRGTVAHVDLLLIVSEPSLRSLETASEVGLMATALGLTRQLLILNRATPENMANLPALKGLPQDCFVMPILKSLQDTQMSSGSVLNLGLESNKIIDAFLSDVLSFITENNSE